MCHPRALNEAEAIEAEAWYSQFERIGTFSAKARQFGVTRDTLRDAIRRVRGQLTRNTRQKLSAFEIDRLAEEILAGTNDTCHVERSQTGEECQKDFDGV